MGRIYANENFPLPAVEELRRLGHDVTTVQESGKGGLRLPDEEVLSFAATDRRVLVTLNRRHFIRLHQEGRRHEGIVVCTFDPDFVGLARRIDDAVRRLPEIAGKLVRVERPSR